MQPYMASLLHFSNIPRQLRSSTSQQLSIPRTKLNLGKRAFSVAAPIIWNELPTTLKSCESLASFHKNLKTSLQNCFSTLNSWQPLKLMMTPICPRLLNMINDFVLLRFRARSPEDLSAIEVIYLLLLLLLAILVIFTPQLYHARRHLPWSKPPSSRVNVSGKEGPFTWLQLFNGN